MQTAISDKYRLATEDPGYCLNLLGNWCFANGIPPVPPLLEQLAESRDGKVLRFNVDQLDDWDSGLMTFLVQLIEGCKQQEYTVDQSGLPQGAQKLLALAFAVPERKGARRKILGQPILTRVGNVTEKGAW